MTTHGRVIVVSSANADIVVNADRIPGPGETVHGSTVAELNGGKGANQAVAAARAGAEVIFIGALGDDAAGDVAMAGLVSEGVDTSHTQVIPGGLTGRAYITVGADSENCIVVVPGTNGLVDPAKVTRSLEGLNLTAQDLVVLGYEVADAVVLAAGRAGHDDGARVVLNPSPSRPHPDGLWDVQPIIIANESEAQDLSGVEDPEEQSAAIAAQSKAPVVITLGPAGALLRDGDTVTRVAGAKVSPVDTTGAGDTFAGVFCAGLAAGLDGATAMTRAVAAAGISVTIAGARASSPTVGQIEAALAGK